VDPSQVYINVHPTKQEIKFEDEKIIYAFVQAAVKHALEQFSIAPSLDFSLNADIQQLDAVSKPMTQEQKQQNQASNLYKTFTQKHQAHFIEKDKNSELKNWRLFFETTEALPIDIGGADTSLWQPPPEKKHIFTPLPEATLVQLHQTYIIVGTDSGFVLLHQQLAHERILSEKFQTAMHVKPIPVQQSMFPSTIELSAADASHLSELIPELLKIGFQLEAFGNNTFVIQGTPADVVQGNEQLAIELLIEQFKHFSSDVKFSKREKLIRCMSRQQAIKAGKTLSQSEKQQRISDLLQCATPNYTINGSPTFLEFKEDYL
jgi:DNA mismatch repair protein MutL